MKNIALCLLLVSLTGCYQYIDSGNVGVRVSASGTNKGVDPKSIGVGRAWYNPITETIYEFPVYEQNVLWAKDSKEGDQSITISSSQSAQINVDVGMTFEIQDEKVPVLFDKLRKDIDYISHQWMRNHVREALGRTASRVDTMLILGEGKEKMLDDAKAALNKDLKEYGISVKMLSFASSPRPEAKIQASIDATITAKQLSIQAENKVAQSKAEADQEIEKARGRAKSMELESAAKLKAATMEAEGNLVLAKSVTPALIQYQAMMKWDGSLPKITGGITPFVDITKTLDSAPHPVAAISPQPAEKVDGPVPSF
jgi:regulator of protease activity HflC (stomatin/prohibitin superfamily)